MNNVVISNKLLLLLLLHKLILLVTITNNNIATKMSKANRSTSSSSSSSSFEEENKKQSPVTSPKSILSKGKKKGKESTDNLDINNKKPNKRAVTFTEPVTASVKAKKQQEDTAQRPKNSGRRWSVDDEVLLMDGLDHDINIEQISETLGRTVRSLKCRLCLMAERELVKADYFTTLDNITGEDICHGYYTTMDEVLKYRHLNTVRQERRAAKLVAKHNISENLRQLNDGLYLRVAAIPNSKLAADSAQMQMLHEKIIELQQCINNLSEQLNERNERNDGRKSPKSFKV